MSKASNKLDWCLKKAEKELVEKDIHRGLVKKEQDRALAARHIVKAEHNLNAALDFPKFGYSDWSPSAFFYSIYHCFLAILAKFGYESRNQECSIAVVETLKEEGKIDIDSKFIETLKINKDKNEQTAIETREDFQYGTQLEFKETEEFNRLQNICKELIDETKKIVFDKAEKLKIIVFI